MLSCLENGNVVRKIPRPMPAAIVVVPAEFNSQTQVETGFEATN